MNSPAVISNEGPIGIFGGTFDPIHYGHLRTAFELWQSLKLSEVRFLPTGNPPHRERTLADARLRVAMVRAAVADQPPFTVDDREVRRSGASYTFDTLTELRGEFPHRSLCLLLGWTPSWGCRTGIAGASCSTSPMWWSRIARAGKRLRRARWEN